MSALNGISVDITIALGSAQVPIRQILKMGRGATIPLDCGHDDPTLLYVNGELVARGRVIVTRDQMSLEITELVRKGRG